MAGAKLRETVGAITRIACPADRQFFETLLAAGLGPSLSMRPSGLNTRVV